MLIGNYIEQNTIINYKFIDLIDFFHKRPLLILLLSFDNLQFVIMKTFKFYAHHNTIEKDKIQIPGNNNNFKYIKMIYFQLHKHRRFFFNSRYRIIIIFIQDHNYKTYY